MHLFHHYAWVQGAKLEFGIRKSIDVFTDVLKITTHPLTWPLTVSTRGHFTRTVKLLIIFEQNCHFHRYFPLWRNDNKNTPNIWRSQEKKLNIRDARRELHMFYFYIRGLISVMCIVLPVTHVMAIQFSVSYDNVTSTQVVEVSRVTCISYADHLL